MNQTEEQNPYREAFNTLKESQFKVANRTYKQRIQKLKKLRVALEHTFKNDIRQALYEDFKKPFLETDLSEIYPVISEIKLAQRELKSWTGKHSVSTPWALFGATSWIKYEPKGVCLIIAPWNFPFNLLLSPLVSAVAAGNVVILKPSEMAPHSAKVLDKISKHVFEPNEVILVQGGIPETEELLKLPFNHIFFTGSTAVGKIIMREAAKNLTSVTLELGGKSPTIIDASANIEAAVQKIVFGKCLNAGQTCIAPDYLLVHDKVKDRVIDQLKKTIKQFYSENPETAVSFSRIVNQKHLERLEKLLQNALSLGATVECGGLINKQQNYMEPTVLSDVAPQANILKEEIFGPILPVLTFSTLEEAIAIINTRERPLAMYIYSKTPKNITQLVNNTRTGGTCINNNLVHFLNHQLPFGGVNSSGIGKSHGFFGFEEFSNKRAMLKQHIWATTKLIYPPYNKFKQKIVDAMLKWF